MFFSIFNEYIKVLRKCESIELENSLFFEFIKNYPEYNHYYSYGTGEFDSKAFLENLIETGALNPNGNDIGKFNEKEYTNTHYYLESLITMNNAYYHIVFCLPLFLKNIKKETFFTTQLKRILVEPYNVSEEKYERSVGTQALLIEAIGSMYPGELKNILKDCKFDMVVESSELVNYNKDDKNTSIQNYYKFLKYICKFLH